ncbi:hypothetical protein P8452_56282 [Trifolium repens]|nr:hypothetical protein P8452_56282 [Trifolium repens]
MVSPSKGALPPNFMNDVKMGNTIKDFVEEFAAFWMPPFENLKHWKTITQMFQSHVFSTNLNVEKFNKEHWSVVVPMEMTNDTFQIHYRILLSFTVWTRIFPYKAMILVGVTGEIIRMRLTMNLLLGDHNKPNKKLEDYYVLAWSTKRAAKII